MPQLLVAQTQPLYSTLDSYLRTQTQDQPARSPTPSGQLDTRTQLSPCDAFEPFRRQATSSGEKPRSSALPRPVVLDGIPGGTRFRRLPDRRTHAAGRLRWAPATSTRSGDLGSLPANIITDEKQAIGKTVTD